MCLIFFAINQHPEYKLIVAGNRDEFYNRKTEAAHFWNDYPDLLAGRDLEAMGTWLGINRQGKISMLTNFRDPKNINPSAPSRGKLVSDYLIGEKDAKEYIEHVREHGKLYNGFNLIAGTPNSLYYYSNYGNGIQKLTQGSFGLSNHLLDTPWPKVSRGKEKFNSLISKPYPDEAALLDFLYDDQRAEDESLPSTGISLERERALSSMFIKTPDYGSRCSTVIFVSHQGEVSFHERVYDLKTFDFTASRYHFDL